MTSNQSVITKDSPLLFMHIPKTGGMSAFTAFAALWGTSIADLYDISPRKADAALSIISDREKILYCGHYAFGLHEWFDRPVYYASVLREPISRLTSLYHYCQPMLTHYRTLFDKVGGDRARFTALPQTSDFYFDFLECFESGLTAENFFASSSPELDNAMVRRFSGYGINPDPCPEHMLAQAKQNIEESFSVVGLLEQYQETLQLMSQVFNLPSLAENQVNVNPQQKEREALLPPQLVATIREQNALDIKLYEWVKVRFNAQLNSPPKAIPVSGMSRREAAGLPLWRAVGQSPLREQAMKVRGVPTKKKGPDLSLLCTRLATAGLHSQLIFAEIQTMQVRNGKAQGTGPLTRLLLSPETARTMVEALTKSLDAYEAKFPKNA